jgi:hypothetical protein
MFQTKADKKSELWIYDLRRAQYLRRRGIDGTVFNEWDSKYADMRK